MGEGINQTRQVIASLSLHLYPLSSETPLLPLSVMATDLLGPGSLNIILRFSSLDFTFFLVSSSYFRIFLLVYHISLTIFPVSWNLFCLNRHWISLFSGPCILLSIIL